MPSSWRAGRATPPLGSPGLASGLVGSSFQIGGAVMLAASTAAALAHTPPQASAAQAVHGLHVGMGVAVAGAGILAVLATWALLTERRRQAAPRTGRPWHWPRPPEPAHPTNVTRGRKA